jgi:hypothetical protein
MLRGYSSPFNLGHRALAELFDGRVYIQEKVDGSQFSFGMVDGELVCRSRGQIIPDLENSGMFLPGVKVVQDLAERGLLSDGWTYRGEYLRKPKHNTLPYDRVPAGHIILFDIDEGDQHYMDPRTVGTYADLLGLEAVPVFMIADSKPSMEELNDLMTRTSVLGNVKIEGIVIKNYNKYGPDSKVLMGKMVSDDFKEHHSKDWKNRNPTSKDFVGKIIEEYATQARWNKAIQHLQESNELNFEPQDIPLVLREVARDVLADEGEEIKQRLFKHFWKQISRGLTKGLPEHYKVWLAERQMSDGD